MQGKVFAVTGAGSGIGRATAVRLAELGAQGIAISDVNEAALEETKAQCMQPDSILVITKYIRGLLFQGSQYQARVTLKKVDVAEIEEVDSWIKEVVQDHGKLDGAANVAGLAGGEGQVTEDIVRAVHLFNHPISRSTI